MARSPRVVARPLPRSKKTSPSVTNHHQPLSPSPRRSSRLRSSPGTDASKRMQQKEEEEEEEKPAAGGGERSPKKRRRTLDHYDLVSLPSGRPDLNHEYTTPRALRALKRQRLHRDIEQAPSCPEPSPSGHRHHRPSSAQSLPVCPDRPPHHADADNDPCIVPPDAQPQLPSLATNASASALSLPPAPAPAEERASSDEHGVAVAQPAGAASPSIGAATDATAPSGVPPSVPADRSPSPAPASSDVSHARATPAPAQNQDVLEAPAPAPVPMLPAPEAPFAHLAVYMPTPEEQWASIAASVDLRPDTVISMPMHRWRKAVEAAGQKAGRRMRAKNQKAEAWVGTWKYEMMVRVESMMEWATRELVHVYSELQAREDRVDFYNFSVGNLPDDVVGMMHVDDDADDADDSDDDSDDEDDEDFDVYDSSHVIMEVAGIEPAPEFVQGCSTTPAATEDPNRCPEPPTPKLTAPPSAIPPRFRTLPPRLPGLFSFHTGPFEPPLEPPDGLPYLGRGTPVDKRRRNDWATIRPAPPPPPPRYTPAEESWFAALVTTPSVVSGSPAALAPDAAFGAPPFCCTQDGLYGAEGSMLPPDYAAAAAAGTFEYPATQSWVEPALRAPDPFVPFAPDLAAGFPVPAPPSGPGPAAAAAAVAVAVPHGGCLFHGTLMECLTSGLGCVSGTFASPPPSLPLPLVSCNMEAANPPGGMGMGLGAADGAPYEVPLEPVPVQASSALSHALG